MSPLERWDLVVATRASSRLTCLVVALASAVAAFAPTPVLGVGSSARASTSVAPVGGCGVPLLDRPTRGSEVKAASAGDLAAAARVNHVAVATLSAEVTADRTLWLDTCGHMFFVEPAQDIRLDAVAAGAAGAATGGQAEQVGAAQAGATTDPGPLSSALMLESKPGATKTIYLDFNGGTVSGTGWNAYSTPSGAPIIAAPYSITPPADTSFTDAELTQIQQAWQVVAEDYAPFDVNVSTKPPAPGAIDRSGPADLTYGTRVLITDAGPICSCGGVAYVDTFSETNPDGAYHQPAWVYTRGSGTSGKTLGEAASHEAGHNLGLHHDGTTSPVSPYYTGSSPWAPIMGAAYNQPVSQFSKHEYAGANNTAEDDLAVISTYLAVRADDHANTAVGATPLSSTPVDGVIATRTDTDAFTFVAGGTTTITASPGPGWPDLDIGLRILGSTGAEVAYVDPPAAPFNASRATGLDATWTATLPDTPATYTAIVDGVGSGDPLTPGKFSDYGSLGFFRIALNGPPVATSLEVTSSDPAGGTVGVAYAAVPASADGGTPPYSWTATAGLPLGLRLDAATANLTGTPAAAGVTSVTVQVTDAAGSSATTSFTFTVNPAPAQPSPPPPTIAAVTVDPVSIATRSRTSFSRQLVARGGTGAYAWAATGTPARVTVSSTGLVAGSVGLPGTYSFPATVKSGLSSTTTTITLSVLRRQALTFVTAKRLSSGQVGRGYRTTIATRGAEGRVTVKRSGKTPPGLRLVPRKSGRITVSGVPTKTGTYVFRIVATDATGARCVRRFTLSIIR